MKPSFYPALLLTLMFFLSGIDKIFLFSKTSFDFSTKINIPLSLSKFVISCVIVLEIIAPIIILIYTFKGSLNFNLLPWFKVAVISLIAFTVAATLMYHNPFIHYYEFLTHVSIIGGLLALYKIESRI